MFRRFFSSKIFKSKTGKTLTKSTQKKKNIKRPASAYNLFIKDQLSGSTGLVTNKIADLGRLYKSLPPHEKQK